MSLRLRLCLFAALAAALAYGEAADAAEKPRPKQQEGVPVPPMRPVQKPEAPGPAPPPVILASPIPRADFPDSAPRIGGLSEQATGGASCRTDCSSRYYRCLATDEMSNCSPAWGQCQAACPPISSSR